MDTETESFPFRGDPGRKRRDWAGGSEPSKTPDRRQPRTPHVRNMNSVPGVLMTVIKIESGSLGKIFISLIRIAELRGKN